MIEKAKVLLEEVKNYWNKRLFKSVFLIKKYYTNRGINFWR